MKEPLTFARLQELFEQTERRATPHRTPDFDAILKAGVAPETSLTGTLMFLEDCNTGGPALLERWRFSAQTVSGQPLSFYADLLPGLVSSSE